jgi:hypothetical protein
MSDHTLSRSARARAASWLSLVAVAVTITACKQAEQENDLEAEAECLAIQEDDVPSASYNVEIYNHRATPVFVGPLGCGVSIFQLSDAEGNEVEELRPPCDCSCADLLASEESFDTCMSCSSDCGPDLPYMRIEPGAGYVATWDGSYYEHLDAPLVCTPWSEWEGYCSQTHVATEGVWTARISVVETVSDCWNGAEDCSCPQGEETCVVYPGALGDAAEVSNTLDLDGGEAVVLDVN